LYLPEKRSASLLANLSERALAAQARVAPEQQFLKKITTCSFRHCASKS
jgi:hypothetical protein